MDTLLFTLNAVLPAFLIIGIGILAGRTTPNLDPIPLARLGTYFTTPALIASTVSKAEISAELAGHIALAYVLFLLLLSGVTVLLTRGHSVKRRSTALVTTLFSNTGNMGLSLSLFAYGHAGLERSVIIFVLSMLFLFTLGPALMAGENSRFGRRLLETWKLPPVWAAVGGILINIGHVQLPLIVSRVLELLGGAAVPLMLLLLGIQINRSWSWDLKSINWLAVGLKTIAAPLVAVAVGMLLRLRGLELSVLVLTASLPTAVNVFGVVVEMNGDYEDAGRTIFMSTILSLVSIGLCILLSHTFLK